MGLALTIQITIQTTIRGLDQESELDQERGNVREPTRRRNLDARRVHVCS